MPAGVSCHFHSYSYRYSRTYSQRMACRLTLFVCNGLTKNKENMKQLKSTFLLTVLMSMVGLQVFADFDTSTKVQVGDLYFYLDNENSQAQVTSMPLGKYTGDITIPSSVTYDEITYSVTDIGERVFYGCSDLTSINIPNSVTSIGSYAFYKCSGLTSITIPNSVTSIGNRAFCECSGLNSINIPNSVTSIGNYAFDGCSSMSSITIPNSVTSIGSDAFAYCSSLTSITIPNSVTSIGNYAFADCFSLTSVTVDINSPLVITDETFSNRTNATLYVPAGSKAAYEAADYWKEFKEIVEMEAPNIVFADPNVKAICVAHWDTDNDGELSKAEAAAVTDLGVVFTGAITSFDELQYFTGLTNIGVSAFNGSDLTSITIPSSVTSIEGLAIANCRKLTSITIPNSVTSIGWDAFYGCTGLTSITIPNSVTSIGNDAFRECSGLTSITIPNNVTSIGDRAFSGCSGLTSITIPNSVTSIGGGVFIDCSDLTSISIESGNMNYDSRDNCNAIIETANNKLIAGCKSTFIPNSVTSIGDYAFQDCSGLTSITIPNSVTNIGEYNQEIKGKTNVEIIPVSA